MKTLQNKMMTVLMAGSITFVACAQSISEFENEGYTSLFNGKDLTGWILPEGDNGHWNVVEGVIDYDAQSEAKDDKNLWSEKEYEDFQLHVE